MLKQTITYKDYEDNEVTKTLHFHLSKNDLIDNFSLKPRLEALRDDIQKSIDAGNKDLTEDQIIAILNLVRDLARLSYGEKLGADDFDKSPEAFARFHRSNAYDAFLMSLFENGEKALVFINGIMPADLIARAEADILEQAQKSPARTLPTHTPASAAEQARMLGMSKEAMEAALEEMNRQGPPPQG